MDSFVSGAAEEKRLVVPVESAGWRLDQFVASELLEVSRTRVQELVEAGRITVDGHSARASLKLRGGEQVSIAGEPRRAEVTTRAEAIPLEIVYQDKWLAVVNKPAGMMVHAGAGASDEARGGGTLVNALLHLFGQLSTVGGALRPGIVHRLDKETSGLMVIARTDEAHEALAAKFAAREMTKTYIALVEGAVEQDAGTVELAIRRDAVKRTRMSVVSGPASDGARAAVTHYRVTERIDSPFGRFTMLRLRIETGRTHQIRVHMASLRHPVVGDTLYGAAGTLQAQRRVGGVKGKRETLRLGRNFLHAAELEFDHPMTGEHVAFRVSLPADLLTFRDQLLRESEATTEVAVSQTSMSRRISR